MNDREPVFEGGMDERRLVERLAAGDSSAAGELVERYRQPLYAFIMRMVTDPADADDIFQETWIQVVRTSGGFRGDSKFSTWLFQIALNKSRDEIRRKRRRVFVPIEDAHNAIGCDPGIDAFRMMTADKVRELVDSLPERFREVTVLRYFHDLSDTEIAEVTGSPVNTVRTRCFRAAAMLRKKWKHAESSALKRSNRHD